MVSLDHEVNHGDCERWGSGNSILNANARLESNNSIICSRVEDGLTRSPFSLAQVLTAPYQEPE